MPITVALAGNPNSGKTTLYNALTGSEQTVGNWPGVTVEKRQAPLTGRPEATLVDLPGVYSLTPHALEEAITRDYLRREKPDVILNVADATNLERNLYLTLELLGLGIPVAVALNMSDELAARGGRVDEELLARRLGAPVVSVSARKGEGLDALAEALGAPIPAPGRAWPALPEARYGAIEQILDGAYQRPRNVYAVSDAIDRFALHRFAAFPLFFAAMGLMFFLTFGPLGAWLTALCASLVGGAAVLISDALAVAPAWFRSLAVEGIVAGVGGVITFLPQILLLFLCLGVLEDSGYMARAAFIADRALRGVGLSGRAFIPMLMGLGCTTTAVIGARAVESERDRRMTVLLTPLMSCGAKLPVYALFAGALFPARQGLVVASLYLTGVLVLAACALVLRRTTLRAGDAPYIMELPPYRLPSARNVVKRLALRAKDFLARAGTLIFAMSVVVWFLQSFSPGLRYVVRAQDSLFAALGRAVAPALSPLGFGDWRSGVALLSGLVAKEAVVSTLRVLYAAAGEPALQSALAAHFTPLSAYAFMTFILLYAPCVSAVAAMKRELGGWRTARAAICAQTAVAYLLTLLVYQAGRLLFPA